MKKFAFFALMLFASLCINAQRSYETVDGDPMKVRIYTLPNGLKVFMSVNNEKPRVTAHIAVNTGHRNDPAETTGLAHYLEHLMFKGTTHFGTISYKAEKPFLDKITQLYEEHYRLTDPEARKAKYHEIDSVSQLAAQYNIPNEYDKLMASIGGEGSNAYTWYDITCYTEDVPSNELENWAKIQSDRFQNLVIRGFHTELEAVYEEKNISLASDGEKQMNAYMAKLFPSHSYGTQTTIGTQEHLKNPSIVNILNYYNRYYKPNNIAICLVGDLDCDKTMDIIEKHFGSWQPGADISPRQFPEQPVFTSPIETSVVGIEEESIMLGWRFKGAADLQNDTLSLIDRILSNGKAGLIDLDLNQKMVVQGAGSDLLALKDYSTLILSGEPNEGQSLDEVKSLILGEVEKVKKGDFDESILTAIVNNMKLQYNRSIEENRGRVGKLVDSYINGEDWKAAVGKIDRISKLTKADIVKFANEHFTDGYVCVKKIQGEDTSIKKIDKPQITPIPTNRDMHSAFLDEIVASQVEPISPVFVDFKKELTFASLSPKLSTQKLIYKQNTLNDIFSLSFHYDFGTQADNRYANAAEYLSLLGTDKLSNEDIQKKFYSLACSYNINVSGDVIDVTISGLNENLAAALQLTENILQNAKADKDIYNMYVEQTLKQREDGKKEQRTCFSKLWDYALYGEYNPSRNIMTADQLKTTEPQALLNLLKGLSGIQHRVLYYGPSDLNDLIKLLAKNHKTAKTLAVAPENKPYQLLQTPQTEILISPYDAKNIYMRKYCNEGKPWSVANMPVINVFNEYFGGGMNTIVFQELREARGLAYNANALYVTPRKADVPEYVYEHIISQNDKMMDCISVFADITDNMPQSEAAFQLAKQSIEKSIQSRRITRGNLISYYLSCQKLGLVHDFWKDIYEQLPTIQLSDIVRFEKSTMVNKPWRFAILGDEKELDMESLGKIGPIKRISTAEIFGY
ncbi:MAG: insulinase family protein [Prevotellaceae bacterium]|nr:insulinase family protein [Candidatus Minthosoma equi]